MAFKRLKLATNYQGKEYNFDIDSKDVQFHDSIDNMWQYWTTMDDWTFEVEGRVSIGGYPLPEGLYVHIYPKKSEYIQRIAGQIPNIVEVENDEEDCSWKTKTSKTRDMDTRIFEDLIVGDVIYLTNDWDLYKLTIGEVKRVEDGINFIFEQNNEYFNLNSGKENDDECITHIIVPYSRLSDFVISFDDYKNCFWADRLQCRENVKYHLKQMQANFAKIGQSYYKWTCKTSCSADTESGWSSELTKSEKTYKSKEECYSDMREDAMASINSFAISDSEMKQHQKVIIEFQPDAVWVDVGEDIRYTYNIVEC